ncbi:MAG TPA: mechanosensitive ion channel family protein [Candidatus Sulfotelmatobacter sp.]|nr:mechanosensitive ion channel family protein [Candidatus Sulfotelmatobacter sp.]
MKAIESVRGGRAGQIWRRVAVGTALAACMALQAQTPSSNALKNNTAESSAAKSDTSKSDTSKNNTAPKSSPSSTQDAQNRLPSIQFDNDAVLHHLNQVISWYRHATTGVSSVGLPSDTIYQDNAKNLGAQIVRLAFESAKAEAELSKAQQETAGPNQAQATTQEQTLTQMQAKISGQIDQIQSQIQKLTAEIPKARAADRKRLNSQKAALESELDLQKALLEAVQKMAAFVETNGEVATGLEGGISQLARSIPEVLGPAAGAPAKPLTATAPAKPSVTNAGGLVGEAVTLYDYMTSVHQIEGVIKETNYLRDVVDHVRTPIRDSLRAAIQQSQKLANQPPSTDPQQLEAERETFQEVTERFKQLSGVLMPLSQELIVLKDVKTNFEEWSSSIARESGHVLRAVLIRVGGILFALGLILALSEVWRRVTFRYVADARRRRQFLVLRRVVIGFLFVVVLILGFVSEFSSLATFAGFISAGIAVGLQAVLLSVAAYFFIIGRYGIRVGDRISVAGITGDVVDIGLVRLYLVEMAGTGLDFYPTGRLVVFSNSVSFKPERPYSNKSRVQSMRGTKWWS